MDRGRLGGLALDIPLNQQRVVAQQTTAPEQQSVQYAPPVAKDPLAERRGMTADYYDSYALLQKIVKDAMSQGIDPFKPDYSQPGGGEAFQAFTEAEALLMHAANRLGNELKAETQMRPLIATGETRMNSDVDPQKGFAYSDPRNFYSTKLDPRTVAANQRTAQSLYTDRDVNAMRQAVHDPNVAALKDTYQGEALEYQMGGALPPVKEAYPPAYFNTGVDANKQPRYLALHKNITNHTRGVWAPGTYTEGVVRGQPFQINRENNGLRFGRGEIRDKAGRVVRTVDKVVKQTLKDGNGNVYYQYEDPELPLELVSNQPPDKVVARHMSSDDVFGGANAVSNYYNELEKAGYIDSETRSTNPRGVFGETAPTLARESRPQANLSREMQVLKEQYNKLVNGDGGFTNLTMTTPSGQVIKFAYDDNDGDHNNDGIYISNWKELGMNKEDRKKNLSFDDMLKVMDEFELWQPIMNRPKKKGQLPMDVPEFTDRQKRAIKAYKEQKGKEPSNAVLFQILEKYK